jgi:hypothetical protein
MGFLFADTAPSAGGDSDAFNGATAPAALGSKGLPHFWAQEDVMWVPAVLTDLIALLGKVPLFGAAQAALVQYVRVLALLQCFGALSTSMFG